MGLPARCGRPDLGCRPERAQAHPLYLLQGLSDGDALSDWQHSDLTTAATQPPPPPSAPPPAPSPPTPTAPQPAAAARPAAFAAAAGYPTPTTTTTTTAAAAAESPKCIGGACHDAGVAHNERRARRPELG